MEKTVTSFKNTKLYCYIEKVSLSKKTKNRKHSRGIRNNSDISTNSSVGSIEPLAVPGTLPRGPYGQKSFYNNYINFYYFQNKLPQTLQFKSTQIN